MVLLAHLYTYIHNSAYIDFLLHIVIRFRAVLLLKIYYLSSSEQMHTIQNLAKDKCTVYCTEPSTAGDYPFTGKSWYSDHLPNILNQSVQ